MNRVNAAIALVFALAIVAGWFLGKVSNDAFMGLAGGAIVYFFPKATTPPTLPPGK